MSALTYLTYLPREFKCILLFAIYVSPDANYKNALQHVYEVVNAQMTRHSDGVCLVAGVFNGADLRSVLPKLY